MTRLKTRLNRATPRRLFVVFALFKTTTERKSFKIDDIATFRACKLVPIVNAAHARVKGTQTRAGKFNQFHAVQGEHVFKQV